MMYIEQEWLTLIFCFYFFYFFFEKHENFFLLSPLKNFKFLAKREKNERNIC